jgi:hypothetical protein
MKHNLSFRGKPSYLVHNFLPLPLWPPTDDSSPFPSLQPFLSPPPLNGLPVICAEYKKNSAADPHFSP